MRKREKTRTRGEFVLGRTTFVFVKMFHVRRPSPPPLPRTWSDISTTSKKGKKKTPHLAERGVFSYRYGVQAQAPQQ